MVAAGRNSSLLGLQIEIEAPYIGQELGWVRWARTENKKTTQHDIQQTTNVIYFM
jgi:hypothetical protein